DAVTVVCVSDTHNTKPRLPPGDVLVHAGDLTASGTRRELREALGWIRAQPHRFKVVVAGNHDLCLDKGYGKGIKLGGRSRDGEGSSMTYAGREIRVYGSPYTPRHGNWAFQYPRSGGAAPYCSSSSSSLRTTDVDNATSDPWRGTIPPGTDVLVTHAPPKGHMDDPRGHWGCEMLLAEVWRARPRLHVFGHVHCGRGREAVAFDGLQAAYE
ncbi:Metallo-dependent phosphatase-like protein, partial [Colletotrichum lupini]